jgi:hypothetical protein
MRAGAGGSDPAGATAAVLEPPKGTDLSARLSFRTVQALREEKIVRNRFTSRVGSGRQTAGKAQQAGALFGGREPSC